MKNPATRESFIEEWPLYAQCDIENFFPPDNVSLHCDTCEKETTWVVKTRGNLYQLVGLGGFYVSYVCQLCQEQGVAIFLRRIAVGTAETGIQKIGQFPPQSINIPTDVSKRLGDDAELYKNALVCRNHNFGIGALAYMRRVVENKTNELIEVVAAQAESYGTEAAVVAKIRAAKDNKISYDERLRLASEAIPTYMKPDGANPLAAIYGLLSEGMHAKSDQDCLVIADEIKDVFEYVFARLRAEIEDRNSMVEKVKKLVGKRK
ncbi:MAG TPA: hypothetical protein VNH19_05555 [Candidatus Limnocylindrales bacterium]|nr:hypothetical protein [Candidatus Limnocylindrales bacterium]